MQRMAFPIVAILVLTGPAHAGAQSAPAAVEAAPARSGSEAPAIGSVRDLLDGLERSDKGLRSLSALVQYDKRLTLQGDRQVRKGTLHFRSEEPAAPNRRPRRMFAVSFDQLFIDGQLIDEPEQWVFDGEWLVEKHPNQKQFTKRRIAPPDADFDPLRVGEGPLPIPIGQKADDILARYDAELRAPGELFDEQNAAMGSFVNDTIQLRLTPKPGRDDEFTEIRLWYRWDAGAGRFLPRMVRTVNRSGDEAYVQLLQVRTSVAGEPAGDAPPAGVFSVEPPTDPSWQVQVIEDTPSQE